MTYIKCDSENANFNFALEKYAMDELDLSDGYFMFWRTTPTLMVGRYQNILAEINMRLTILMLLVFAKGILISARMF